MKRLLLILLAFPLLCSAEQAAFLTPPQYVAPPDTPRMHNNRALTMVSSLAISPKGRMWATWYAGITPREDHNNYVVLATSGDGGKQWQEVLIVDPDAEGPVRAFDPEVWMAPDGNLYLIWAQAQGHEGSVAGVWAIKITNPEEGTPQYESPTRWTDGIMMCKPIVLSSGEWVLPASTWRATDFSARMVFSTDQGKSWRIRGAANVPKENRSFDEHMIVERKDDSLWMLCRTNYGIGESVSLDRGKTWSEVAPSDIAHPSARFFISRLKSGNLLLVKHGGIHEKTRRSHLRAFISSDDGQTWQGGLLLDERIEISYPDGQQAADGTIYITYDHRRTREREILFASFKEEDALSGKDVSGHVNLRQLISKGSGGEQKPKNVQEKFNRNSNQDGVTLQVSPAGALQTQKYSTAKWAEGALLFTDRAYTVKESIEALKGYTLLQTPITGKKDYICNSAGMVYFLTPQPQRNPDSQSRALLDQGFQKVAMPEIELFSAPAKRSAQLCTLYQKKCKKGEVIRLGKWAIPLMAPSIN